MSLKPKKRFWSKLRLQKPNLHGPAKAINFQAHNSFEIKNLNLWYHQKSKPGLVNISLQIPKNKVTALIGSSGCGKSTLLRCLNRMNDEISDVTLEGEIYLNGTNIYAPDLPLDSLRMQVGMVFQKPSPFPMSIIDNVTYSLKAHGIHDQSKLREITIKSLKSVGLYDEVCDNLERLGNALSGGQQQRLCIARTIACEPDILLMDEPTSALDPLAVSLIEELITQLANKYTIVLVSHSMSQVQRVSDYTVFMAKGKIIEANTTRALFTAPQSALTKKYIMGDH